MPLSLADRVCLFYQPLKAISLDDALVFQLSSAAMFKLGVNQYKCDKRTNEIDIFLDNFLRGEGLSKAQRVVVEYLCYHWTFIVDLGPI